MSLGACWLCFFSSLSCIFQSVIETGSWNHMDSKLFQGGWDFCLIIYAVIETKAQNLGNCKTQ